ncbi:MAG TPA: hypothetical protein PKN80_01760 [bacterium]|uniref:Uncharacterized protein n=1 Tax=candidate division TA06 bacterium ADurb.Bin417 TaxID=1852828 RepID=A0A1V5MIA2_UNCT6|nr:MAG: hypothetical protein BWY73_00543 [candidate division TA06 bacterium ADurb.Bin417]HNQ34771.1 hypothetical protein [bacterium]HNS49088.1 hypothetical protein [bacterium]
MAGLVSILSADDWRLVVVVTFQATLLAYLPAPRAKALLLSLPIPFTLATLALGRPVDATNALGLILLLAYTHAVRLLYCKVRLPILAAISLAAAGYAAAACLVSPLVPAGPAAFWISLTAAWLLSLAIYLSMPPRDEPEHRTSLPVWLKMPAVAAVIFCLAVIKYQLRGFLTVFPMVGLVAAYESRYSLWTLARQISLFLLASAPMLAVVRLAEPVAGLEFALAAGWLVFLPILTCLRRFDAPGRMFSRGRPRT